MVIAINKIPIFDENKSDDFFYEIFTRIIKANPLHTFLVIALDIYPGWQQLSNITYIQLREKPGNTMVAQLSFTLKLKKILKKNKAELFIQPHYFRLKSEIPQILFSPELSFINQAEYCNKKYVSFIKKNASYLFSNAASIIVSSEYEKKIIGEYSPVSKKITSVVYEGLDAPISESNFEEREEIKEKFSGGNEYFIYYGGISTRRNLVNLLKAFSAFKKRQRSGMQLIIAGHKEKGFEDFSSAFEKYRFKNEVQLLTDIPKLEIEKLIASSYAMICPSGFETSATAALKAMQYSIPVIAAGSGIVPGLCKEAALYFDPSTYKEIAEKMMLIFKDEALRTAFIEKGKAQVQNYHWNKSADLTWKIMVENAKTFE